MAERKSLSKKIRFEVFKRDSFTCQYCGKSAPDTVLEVDHIIPVAKDGTNNITNLITSCFDCNRGKSDRTLTENQTVKAQKQELDKLNKRKEQLEMMAKWRISLLDIEKDEANKIMELVNAESGVNRSLTDDGIRSMIKLIRKYGFEETLESSIISFNKYDLEIAFKKIDIIAKYRKKDKEEPYLKDLYYIRGILRKRLDYIDENYAIQLLKKAYKLGYLIEDLKNNALTFTRWEVFEYCMTKFIEGKEAGGDLY